MRNEVSFPKSGLLSAQISELMSLPGQTIAEQHTLLMHMLEVLKSDRIRLKATGRMTAKGETNLLNMTLTVARKINALRAKDSDLSTLVKRPEQHISALSGVLTNLTNEQASRLHTGMPMTLLTKVTQSITHTIDTLKDPTMHLAADLPHGKPPPQYFSSGSSQTGSFLRSVWSSALQAILPASKRFAASLGVAALAAQMTASSGPNSAIPEATTITPLNMTVIHPIPLPPLPAPVKASTRPVHKAVEVPQRLVHTAPHVTQKAEETVKAVKRTSRRVKENLDDLFNNPEILSVALAKLQNLRVDVAFRKAVLIESGGQQFDQAGNPLKSIKGATGKSQVMPDTAEKIAEKCTGKPLDNDRFHNDPDYNHSLGKCYFKARTAAYRGNPVMGALDYNLGPVRMQQHINRVGDPTQGEVSMVKFIQTMPIKETRHYTLKMLKHSGILEEAAEEVREQNLDANPAPVGP